MKHQYESEILFHLMERDGFNIPSSVPPYESEIKAYLINQVKQAYPKLTDYEAEWLLYNYTKHLPADFPISSATNVTEATFENVVPFAYQSAILKGQTMVNVASKRLQYKEITVTNASASTNYGLLLDGIEYEIPYPLIANKEYLIIEEWDIKSSNDISHTAQPKIIFEDGAVSYLTKGGKLTTLGVHKIVRRYVPVKNAKNFYFGITNNAGNTLSVTLNYAMIIEYQAGMENWDIRYFEDMKSVQMPVLKTTGKNLFDGELQQGFWSTSSGLHVNHQGSVCSVNPIKVQEDTYLTISQYGEVTYNGTMMFLCYDVNGNLLGHVYNRSQVYKNTSYVHFRIYNESGTIQVVNPNIKIQVESSSTPTSYEPYKSNILTTPTDLELRGVGEVQDTLDCLTGELTQRIREVVLDGTEDWIRFGSKDGITLFHLYTNNYRLSNYEITCVAPLKTAKYGDYYPDVWEDSTLSLFSNYHQKNKEGIAIFSNKQSVDEFKSWLSQNPLKMVIMLKNPTVKTVDLKTVNESGESVHFMPLEGTMHVQSSGEPIQPTFDMSVPVEATTQNLASFIDLEMEE